MSSTRGEKILVTGALGQIGTDLVEALREKNGVENVISTDIRKIVGHTAIEEGPFMILDVLDFQGMRKICDDEGVETIYHLGAMLSAVGEKDPELCRRVNNGGTQNVIDVAKKSGIRVYAPSSIAVFGPNSPKLAPQDAELNPTTVYGETKVWGEKRARENMREFGLDLRGIRYPGLVSYKAPAGGGTTDYAVEIFHAALDYGHYECFVSASTRLPMLYMEDAIRATQMLMDASNGALDQSVKSGYNISCLSFTAKELADAISDRVEGFSCDFVPDIRQKYADSWPDSIDGSVAERDWGWKPNFNLNEMVDAMLEGVSSN